jgi:murein DD-endopeptidase MepM/ murein hydrolase activator NlpD
MTTFHVARIVRTAMVMAGVIAAGATRADPVDAGGAPAMVTAAGAAPAMVAGVATAVDVAAETHMRSLFDTWQRADTGAAPIHAGIAIPSVHPVERLEFTSNFGIRSDPFTHGARMHAGVDIRGPVGTPVYATADGIVDRAERAGGYGNLVELDHGKGIQTRYGHLSRILVEAGTQVKRGQLIALMGSTGRSTGSHLHYEVRIDGKAVNPAPFLTTADYLQAAHAASVDAIPVSMTGPAPQD